MSSTETFPKMFSQTTFQAPFDNFRALRLGPQNDGSTAFRRLLGLWYGLRENMHAYHVLPDTCCEALFEEKQVWSGVVIWYFDLLNQPSA